MGTNTEIEIYVICQTEKQIYGTVHQLWKPESNPSLEFKKDFQAKAKGVTVADSSVYFREWAVWQNTDVKDHGDYTLFMSPAFPCSVLSFLLPRRRVCAGMDPLSCALSQARKVFIVSL